MANINFKLKFADAVASGKKTMTIRKAFNKKRGDVFVHLFTGLRTKRCQKLGIGEITKISPITIHENGEIEINGSYLSEKFAEGLAINDGFKTKEYFLDFFRSQYSLPFYGVMIEWKLMRGGGGRCNHV